MDRFAYDSLADWKRRSRRKPLVVRGARQVGKSYLVRSFAEREFERLVEINLEQDPRAATLFASNDPVEIRMLLEARYGIPVEPGRTLLFLDEIQAAPEVLRSLRYFYEQMPALHVIAAGSLLEFALDQPQFSMPVGRIEYFHLGPMQFEEFLLALGKDSLRRYLQKYTIGRDIPEAIHGELLSLMRRFCVVGGMPDAVQSHVESQSFLEVDAAKQSILSTYTDDFHKYGPRSDSRRVEKVFRAIPRLVGGRLKYSNIDREERAKDLAAALDLLCMARVAWKVRAADGNGLPLGAEADDRCFKPLFLDVGLMSKALGLTLAEPIISEDPIAPGGAAAEQFIGQHLLFKGRYYDEPELYYWHRNRPHSNAEVDYLISSDGSVVPVEVKAGKSGTLRSLNLFVSEKGRDFALRFCAQPPSLLDTRTNGGITPSQDFRLLSLPMYLVGQADRLCAECRRD